MKTLEGNLLAGDSRFAIVVSRWNDFVTSKLLEGALDGLKRHCAKENCMTVVKVPGSFELPVAADRLAKSGNYDAVICLGAVIQGETQHHEYINHSVANAIMQSSQSSGIPVLFGLLTCSTMEQAIDRAGGKAGNKGEETALAAIEMVNLLSQI